MQKLTQFTFDGKDRPVVFVETMQVKEGVECDTYAFVGDDSRDLAIVTVKKGYKTPLQRILQGNKTVEGFWSGKGQLAVNSHGEGTLYDFDAKDQGQEVVVGIGDLMQWTAIDTDLVFYEVCDPPYQDGRFENLPEESN